MLLFRRGVARRVCWWRDRAAAAAAAAAAVLVLPLLLAYYYVCCLSLFLAVACCLLARVSLCHFKSTKSMLVPRSSSLSLVLSVSLFCIYLLVPFLLSSSSLSLSLSLSCVVAQCLFFTLLLSSRPPLARTHPSSVSLSIYIYIRCLWVLAVGVCH